MTKKLNINHKTRNLQMLTHIFMMNIQLNYLKGGHIISNNEK